MTRTVNNWRSTCRFIWQCRHLWFNGVTALGLVQIAVVVVFSLTLPTPTRRRASPPLKVESLSIAPAPPANPCPAPMQGKLFDEVAVSGLIRSYTRSVQEGDMPGRADAVAALKARRETARPLLEDMLAQTKEPRMRAALQQAISAIE